MKLILTLSLLLTSTLGFSQTCFKAVDSINSSSKIPASICVHSIEVNSSFPNYSVTIVTDEEVLTKENVNFKKTASNTFKADLRKDIVYRSNGACAGFYYSALNFSFEVDTEGSVLTDTLLVTGIESRSSDECHSPERKTLVRFERI